MHIQRSVIFAIATALAVVGAAACSPGGGAVGNTSGSGTSDTAAAGGTLTIAMNGELTSWAPKDAKGGPGLVWTQPVYDTLLRAQPDGALAPMLATKWSYDSSNTRLTLTLRSGVKFADGTEFTADAVKVNLDAVRHGSGTLAGTLGGIKDIAVQDADTVVITLSGPNPAFLNTLARPVAAMAQPDLVKSGKIADAPVGTGPYVLDKTDTQTNTTYTFTRNPEYWDPGLVHYDTLVFRVMLDRTARLNALLGGQIQGMYGNDSVADASSVKSKGGQILAAPPNNLTALYIRDHAGVVAKPLADVRVRQALNYAIDRDSLVKNLQLGYADATSQYLTSVAPGFSRELSSAYTYDPAKAKQLLAEAGYADGFTLTMPKFSWFAQLNPIVAQELGDIGVKVQWKTVADSDILAQAKSADYAMSVFNLDASSPWNWIESNLTPQGTWNTFHSSNPDLQKLIAAVQNSSDAAALQTNSTALNKWLVEQAWFVPIYLPQAVYFAAASVKVQVQPGQDLPSIYNFSPAR